MGKKPSRFSPFSLHHSCQCFISSGTQEALKIFSVYLPRLRTHKPLNLRTQDHIYLSSINHQAPLQPTVYHPSSVLRESYGSVKVMDIEPGDFDKACDRANLEGKPAIKRCPHPLIFRICRRVYNSR
jgi:hypothetical protein